MTYLIMLIIGLVMLGIGLIVGAIYLLAGAAWSMLTAGVIAMAAAAFLRKGLNANV